MQGGNPQDELRHGTSMRALIRILAADRLETPGMGNPHISTTADPRVSSYWAEIQATCDDRDEVGGRAGARAEVDAGSTGAVLIMSRSRLRTMGVSTMPFSDPVFGDGECDWEAEEAIACAIHPLSDILLRVEVDMDAYERMLERLPVWLAEIGRMVRSRIAALAAYRISLSETGETLTEASPTPSV